MSSVRHANFNRAVVLSLLMMMMTQVGYLESMNAWTNDDETLDESTDVLETGGSGASNFTASAEGADLIIDEAMTNITFQYNSSAASGSGSGSGTTTNGNGTTWQVADINSGTASSDPGHSCRYSSVIRSTSMRMMEAAAKNSGLMIPQTPQLGGWLISRAGVAPVTPDNTCRYSSVIRSTSVRMMEAAARTVGS